MIEAAPRATIEAIAVSNALRARSVIRDGREYLVAPATLLVSGVLNGSQGPLYYPPEEVEANSSDWDGIPIVVYHPISSDGRPISANSQEVLDSQGIGFVATPYAKSGQLKAKLWFDVEATERVDSRVLLSLRRGERIELSTGLSTEKHPAEYGAMDAKGRTYNSIARNYVPDHLAVLPDEIGACSVRDGCGVLVNCGNSPICSCPVAQGMGGWQEVGPIYASFWSPISSDSPTLLSANSSPLYVSNSDGEVVEATFDTHTSLVSNPMGKWQPPQAGDAPKEVNDILRKAYTTYRNKHPQEVASVKARGARIAWSAVRKAGWAKDKDGQWHKTENVSNEESGNLVPDNDWAEVTSIANSTTDMALEEIEHAVRRAFRTANPVKYDPDTGSAIDPCVVVSVFPDYLIYMENWDDLYRQSYTMDADGRVTLENDVEPVRRVTAYVPIESAAS